MRGGRPGPEAETPRPSLGVCVTDKPLISEAMKNAIGVPSAPAHYDVEKGHVRRFAEAIGDPSPRWGGGASSEDMVAPPTFLRICVPNELEKLEMPFSRGLDGGSEWDYFLPVRPGDTITVTQEIIDFSEKHGKLGAMLIETRQNSFVNQRGELVATEKTVGISY